MAKKLKAKTVSINLNDVKIIDLFDADIKPDLFHQTLSNYIYINNQGIESEVSVSDVCKKLFKNEYAEVTKEQLIEMMNISVTYQGYKPFAIDCIKNYFLEKISSF